MGKPEEFDEYQSIAELYDYVIPYQERQDVGFFVQEAVESGGPVLELGCGTGRVLIPTARAGVTITGLDQSSSMLNLCRKKLSSEPEAVRSRVHLVEGDMRSFKLPGSFQLVTIPFRPFQHLVTVEEQLQCLDAIWHHLGKDGRLILDIFNPKLESLVETTFGVEFPEEGETKLPDGRKLTRSHRIVSRDVVNQANNVELIYYVSYPNGKQQRLVQAFPMRYLFRYEAEHLLARTGFVVEQLYADYDKSPFGSKYPGELIFVARKSKQ